MTNCEDRVEKYEQIVFPQILLPLAGGISLSIYALIFYYYFIVKIPPLKRHPSSLVVQKCFWEALGTIQYLWVPIVDRSYFYENEENCSASPSAAAWSFVTQVSSVAGNLQLLILAVDLHRSSSNPFESFKLREKYYRGFVLIVSVTTGIALIGLGNDVYGLASNLTCWIQDSKNFYFLDRRKIELYYAIVCIVWLYAAYVVIVVLRRLRRGLRKSLANRISIMRRSQTYVLGYVLIGLVTIVMEIVVFHTDNYNSGLRTAIAVLDASAGLVSFFILYYPNRDELRAYFQAKGKGSGFVTDAIIEGLSLNPHLNSALRAEVLFFTTLGIRLAAFTEKRSESVESSVQGSENYYRDERSSKKAGSLSSPLVEPLAVKQVESSRYSASRLSFLFASASAQQSRFVFEGFNVSSAVYSNMKAFTCTENIDVTRDTDADDDITNRTSIGMRSSNATSVSHRPSDFYAMQDQQHENMIEDLSFRLDDTLEAFGYARAEKISKPVKKKLRSMKTDVDKSGLSIQSGGTTDSRSNSRQLSIRDIFGFGDTRDGIKENILKAAQVKSSATEETIPVSFEFREYKSYLFSEIRLLCEINDEEYANSFRSITKERFTEGASGAFMFFSSDEKYIVKTTSFQELKSLLEILPAYVSHLNANPNSLIVRYLGAHCVTLYGKELYFVIMKNVFSQVNLSERYDLKGSWVNRHYRDTDSGKKINRREDWESKCPLYLDNDLQHKINLKPTVANALHNQVLRDVSFLCGLDIMDYSLLVGVTRKSFDVLDEVENSSHARQSQNGSDEFPEAQSRLSQFTHTSPIPRTSSVLQRGDRKLDIFQRDKSGGMNAVVVHGPATYYFGIIDILQKWNWQKRVERLIKTVILRRDGNGLSAMPPHGYFARFMTRCVEDVFENLNINDTDDFIPKKFSQRQRVSLNRESDISRAFTSNSSKRLDFPGLTVDSSIEEVDDSSIASSERSTSRDINRNTTTTWRKTSLISQDV